MQDHSENEAYNMTHAHLGESVAQKGRIPVDVTDLRDEIESCRDDAAWSELPLAAKIRVLIRERLDQMKKERSR